MPFEPLMHPNTPTEEEEKKEMTIAEFNEIVAKILQQESAGEIVCFSARKGRTYQTRSERSPSVVDLALAAKTAGAAETKSSETSSSTSSIHFTTQYQLGKGACVVARAMVGATNSDDKSKTMLVVSKKPLDPEIPFSKTEIEAISNMGLLVGYYKKRNGSFSLVKPEDRVENLTGESRLVMKYVPGKSLHHALLSANTPIEALLHLMSALENLKKLHDAGFVCVDVKADNFVCHPIDGAMLIDFSLTKKNNGEASSLRFSDDSHIEKYCRQIPPELRTGKKRKATSLSPAQDVYAVGFMIKQYKQSLLAGDGSDEDTRQTQLDALIKNAMKNKVNERSSLDDVITGLTSLVSTFLKVESVSESKSDSVEGSGVAESSADSAGSSAVPNWFFQEDNIKLLRKLMYFGVRVDADLIQQLRSNSTLCATVKACSWITLNKLKEFSIRIDLDLIQKITLNEGTVSIGSISMGDIESYFSSLQDLELKTSIKRFKISLTDLEVLVSADTSPLESKQKLERQLKAMGKMDARLKKTQKRLDDQTSRNITHRDSAVPTVPAEAPHTLEPPLSVSQTFPEESASAAVSDEISAGITHRDLKTYAGEIQFITKENLKESDRLLVAKFNALSQLRACLYTPHSVEERLKEFKKLHAALKKGFALTSVSTPLPSFFRAKKEETTGVESTEGKASEKIQEEQGQFSFDQDRSRYHTLKSIPLFSLPILQVGTPILAMEVGILSAGISVGVMLLLLFVLHQYHPAMTKTEEAMQDIDKFLKATPMSETSAPHKSA